MVEIIRVWLRFKEGLNMILSFIAGLFIGSIAGVFIMGLCAANGRDRNDE